ncbi:MAG: nitroreductase family protein [Acidimicrobiales bacterium]|nr:nitroreductase family protein [Acidimicrobiales bacterium]|tara:strand:- start:65 stop:595 length:531 start_codon:yes stop_codon:yes gene_type:complete
MRLLGMDAYKAVVEKRDKREFDSRPIPEEILVKIMQATRMAGSGKNRQTGRVVVVTNQEGRESVAASGDFGDWINQASVALVFAIHSDGGLRPDFDIGRMAQNAMIVANSEGLYSCPMTVYRQQELKTALGIPDEYDVPMVVGMGFPAGGSKTSKSHPRIPLEDMVYRETWQDGLV